MVVFLFLPCPERPRPPLVNMSLLCRWKALVWGDRVTVAVLFLRTMFPSGASDGNGRGSSVGPPEPPWP